MQVKLHPQFELASIARQSPTKKVIATRLKGSDLTEAWRIKQLQTQRARRKPNDWFAARLRDDWEQKGLKVKALVWPQAFTFRHDFQIKIAAQIQKHWAYGKYRWHSYSVSVQHNSKKVGTLNQHAGSGCITYPVTIHFDLLRQEAVWIGGLLTIRAKADKNKSTYPCWWFERRASDPHLQLRQGRIVRRNYHEESDVARTQRLEPERQARILRSTRPPKGWVSENSSIKAGNCSAGTRQFINHRLIPFLQKAGYAVGDMTGAAVRKDLILEIERNQFTKRL
jgi:hypothetical protein